MKVRNLLFSFFGLIFSMNETFAQDSAKFTSILEYRRANNMMDANPSAALGTERLVIDGDGKRIEFQTDWKFEKRKSDGKQYFGSHVRFVENKGNTQLHLYVRPDIEGKGNVLVLTPGMKYPLRNDLIAVEVRGRAVHPDYEKLRCVLEYERADNAANPFGLPSNSLGSERIELRLGEEVKFETDRKFEKMKGAPGRLFGSHLRRAHNKSSDPYLYIDLYVRKAPIKLGSVSSLELLRLPNQKSQNAQADLVTAKCHINAPVGYKPK